MTLWTPRCSPLSPGPPPLCHPPPLQSLLATPAATHTKVGRSAPTTWLQAWHQSSPPLHHPCQVRPNVPGYTWICCHYTCIYYAPYLHMLTYKQTSEQGNRYTMISLILEISRCHHAHPDGP